VRSDLSGDPLRGRVHLQHVSSHLREHHTRVTHVHVSRRRRRHAGDARWGEAAAAVAAVGVDGLAWCKRFGVGSATNNWGRAATVPPLNSASTVPLQCPCSATTIGEGPSDGRRNPFFQENAGTRTSSLTRGGALTAACIYVSEFARLCRVQCSHLDGPEIPPLLGGLAGGSVRTTTRPTSEKRETTLGVPAEGKRSYQGLATTNRADAST
jgi:hypothetical protein